MFVFNTYWTFNYLDVYNTTVDYTISLGFQAYNLKKSDNELPKNQTFQILQCNIQKRRRLGSCLLPFIQA